MCPSQHGVSCGELTRTTEDPTGGDCGGLATAMDAPRGYGIVPRVTVGNNSGRTDLVCYLEWRTPALQDAVPVRSDELDWGPGSFVALLVDTAGGNDDSVTRLWSSRMALVSMSGPRGFVSLHTSPKGLRDPTSPLLVSLLLGEAGGPTWREPRQTRFVAASLCPIPLSPGFSTADRTASFSPEMTLYDQEKRTPFPLLQ